MGPSSSSSSSSSRLPSESVVPADFLRSLSSPASQQLQTTHARSCVARPARQMSTDRTLSFFRHLKPKLSLQFKADGIRSPSSPLPPSPVHSPLARPSSSPYGHHRASASASPRPSVRSAPRASTSRRTRTFDAYDDDPDLSRYDMPISPRDPALDSPRVLIKSREPSRERDRGEDVTFASGERCVAVPCLQSLLDMSLCIQLRAISINAGVCLQRTPRS